jgi:hypothetical protein
MAEIQRCMAQRADINALDKALDAYTSTCVMGVRCEQDRSRAARKTGFCRTRSSHVLAFLLAVA